MVERRGRGKQIGQTGAKADGAGRWAVGSDPIGDGAREVWSAGVRDEPAERATNPKRRQACFPVRLAGEPSEGPPERPRRPVELFSVSIVPSPSNGGCAAVQDSAGFSRTIFDKRVPAIVASQEVNPPASKEDIMKTIFSTLILAGVILGPACAAAAELPTFELMGFPISSVQLQVVGSARVKEQSPTPMQTLGGMPASPHQIAVLTPRRRAVEEATALQVRPNASSQHTK